MANLQETLAQATQEVINQPLQVNLSSLAIALILASFLAYLLGKMYVRYGTSLSNRIKFSGNFVMLCATTTLIITVVKSSLALSLGLVGALSIIRFRTAIKEPEELAYLFFVIAIGLGLGASQFLITIIAFVIISVLIVIRSWTHKKEESQNLFISINVKNSKEATLKQITDILKQNCYAVSLKRFDQTEDNALETSFLIDIPSLDALENIKRDILKVSRSASISYLDKSGIS